MFPGTRTAPPSTPTRTAAPPSAPSASTSAASAPATNAATTGTSRAARSTRPMTGGRLTTADGGRPGRTGSPSCTPTRRSRPRPRWSPTPRGHRTARYRTGRTAPSPTNPSHDAAGRAAAPRTARRTPRAAPHAPLRARREADDHVKVKRARRNARHDSDQVTRHRLYLIQGPGLGRPVKMTDTNPPELAVTVSLSPVNPRTTHAGARLSHAALMTSGSSRGALMLAPATAPPGRCS